MLSASSAAHAELNLAGYLAARGVFADSDISWRAGGFGRLEGGDGSGNDTSDFQAQGHVTLNWQTSRNFGAFVHVLARSEADEFFGDEVGVVEAYVETHFTLRQSDQLRLQLGHFIFPTSRENIEFAWSSPYTLTFSALNTWIGEEVRMTGLGLDYSVGLGGGEGSGDQLRWLGSVFGGNDSTGALLAWRGWAFSDRLTTFDEVLPLPPIHSLQSGGGFAAQRDDGTQPFGDDLDGRAGWVSALRWQRESVASVQYTHYDNRGDRDLHAGEYAWRTEFDLFGLELTPGSHWTLAGEWMDGATGMGIPGGAQVQMDFSTWYALVSWQARSLRFTVRRDVFDGVERDFSGADNNTDTGDAWTAAIFWEGHQRPWRLGVEWLEVDGIRPLIGDSGGDPRTSGNTLLVELRWYFDH